MPASTGPQCRPGTWMSCSAQDTSRRHTSRKDYPHSFLEVVKLSVDCILQSADKHVSEAGFALRKLALLSTEAIPLELLTAGEKAAVSLLEEHSLVTADAQGLAAMHALTQLVVRDQLTEGAQGSVVGEEFIHSGGKINWLSRSTGADQHSR